jgi:hypothetical protein
LIRVSNNRTATLLNRHHGWCTRELTERREGDLAMQEHREPA